MYLKDLLLKGEVVEIMYRCNAPEYCDEEDMLFGYAKWDGENLYSGDGDNYYLNDVIERFEWTDDYLIVWIEVMWSSGKDEGKYGREIL